MRTKFYEIPDKMVAEYDSDAKVIIDTWTSYNITLDEFKHYIVNVGVKQAKAIKAIAWMADSGNAKGVFSSDIQEWISNGSIPLFLKNGIKYFFTINSQSSLTNLGIKQYSTKLGPGGIKMINASDVAVAMEWLNVNRST